MQVHCHTRLDSTQLEAVRLLKSHQASPPFYVLSDSQHAGKGRYQRVWQSISGNLHVSYVLPWQSPHVPLLAGLAVYHALLDCGVNTEDLALKWPNDVLLHEQKLAGILCQMHEGLCVIGIGLNVAHSPEDVRFPAIHLAAYGLTISPAELAESIANQLEIQHYLWQEEGDVALMRRWQTHAWRVGETLTVQLHDQKMSGIFLGLDTQGNLLLNTASGTQSVSAGDVGAGA